MKRASLIVLHFAYLFLTIVVLHTPAFGYTLKPIIDPNRLSNSCVSSLYQDQSGLLWLGTIDGLNSYDGREVLPFIYDRDKNELSGSHAEQVIETRDGRIWISTYYGLDRYDKYANRLKSYKEISGHIHIDKDSRNTLFVHGGDGKMLWFSDESDNFVEVDGFHEGYDYVCTMVITPDDKMLLFYWGGDIASYDIEYRDGVPTLITSDRYSHNSGLRVCTKDGDEIFFIDHNSDVFKYDYADRTTEKITSVSNLIQTYGAINSIVHFGNDYYFGFYTGGVWVVSDPGGNEHREKLPINCGVFALLKDKYQDILWIATDGQGVYCYYKDEYSIKSTISTDIKNTLGRPVRCMYIEDGAMWMGFKGDGIIKIDDYTPDMDLRYADVRHFTQADSNLADDLVFAFESGGDGVLWIGQEKGLNYYSPHSETIENVRLHHNGRDIEFVHDIYRQGEFLWIASVNMGVFKVKVEWSEGTPRLTVVKDFVLDGGHSPSNQCYSLYLDGDYIAVANRGKGVMMIDTRDDTFSMLRFDSEIPNETVNEIYCISKDDDGNYLIGTGLGFVIYYPDGDFELLNRTNGFPENMIRGIMKTGANSFWLATNHGLIKFDSRTRLTSTFGVKYGLSISEFSDAAQYISDDGYVMFGGVNGFVTIRENLLDRQDIYMPELKLDRLSIFGREYGLDEFSEKIRAGEPMELNYNQNYFSMVFSAIDYINGNNQIFYYHLDDSSEYWIDNGNSNTISFTNINPGNYELLVRYYNRTTNMESETTSFLITVHPPWYFSNTAKALYIIAVIGLIAFFINYLMNRNKRKHDELMRQLEQQHKENIYESKLSFFTNIAHEFCTPLSLIYGPVNQMMSIKGIDKSTLRYAGLIKNNAERLNALITDLIDFRRMETGHKVPSMSSVAISKIAEETIASLGDIAANRKIALIQEFDKSRDIKWHSDANFIATILNNFIHTAIKYADSGGTVTLNVADDAETLNIAISYTGKGIDESEIIGLADPYHILDNLEHNRRSELNSRDGLALAISYNLIHLLGGELKVEHSSKWTHFYVSLPKPETIGEPADEELLVTDIGNSYSVGRNTNININLPKIAINDSKLTMVVIDSEREILWFMSDVFSDNFNVICLDNVSDKEAVFKDNTPDIVICNYIMPDFDVSKFAKQIKADPDTSHIPLIMLSANHEVETQIEALNAGADLYITLPFNVDFLRTSVEKLLKRKEALKEYFASNISAFELIDGKLLHRSQRKMLKSIIDIINKNIDNQELSAEFIAAEMNMGIRKLYRYVEDIKGIGISSLIRECRLVVASDLLVKSRFTIDEVVFKSGFSNRVSFYKAFSKKYNCTPKEYRERNKLME
jgi:signal transduction histidine kinase/DNA-binding response OmpR family regulator/ligand-binding sensor domain-containing protein